MTNTFQVVCNGESEPKTVVFYLTQGPGNIKQASRCRVTSGRKVLLLTTRREVKKVPQDFSVVKSLQKSNWSLTIDGRKKKAYGLSNTKTS